MINIKHLLIIDDDDRIRDLLCKYMTKNGFVISTSCCAKDAYILMNKYKFNVIIVDCLMPEESGLEFISNIRNKNDNTPIIMLTALGEAENRIDGLSVGADDYMSKPFEPKELVLRVDNILKRINMNKNSEDIVIFDDFKFSRSKGDLYQNDQLIKLTRTESMIFSEFCNNINTVLSRENLCKLCNYNVMDRSIDVQINRIRRKIEKDQKNPKFIRTVRNSGYILVV